jgi:TipAS antibiotic-recognition domain
MQPQEDDFMRKYYTDEAWAKRTLIKTQMSPQTLEEYRLKWKQLFLEVEGGLDLDPASEAAQLLARRWVLLAEAASEGDSEIKAGAIKAWKDHQNWPLDEQDALFARYGLDPSGDRSESMMRVERVAKFIGQAIGRKYYAVASTRFAAADKQADEGLSKRWVELFRDAESSLGEDPASERVQTLVARWTELTRETESGPGRNVPQLDGLQNDSQNRWPSYSSVSSVAVVNQVARLYRIEQVQQFLGKALALRRDGPASA